MSRAVVVCIAFAVGCRFGFDPVNNDGGPGGDGRRDTGTSVDALPLVNCLVENPTAFVCDSFEGAMADTWDYQLVSHGSIAATTTRAHRGAKALEVTTVAMNDYKEARWGTYFDTPIAAGDLYVRAWYWVASSVVFAEQASLLTTGNGVSPYPSTFVVFSPGEVVLEVDSTAFAFPGNIPRDHWVCVRMHILVDPTNGVVDVDIGPASYTAGGTDTLVGATGYTNLDIGLHYATPAQGPITMWIDDLVVDTSPIACD